LVGSSFFLLALFIVSKINLKEKKKGFSVKQKTKDKNPI